jgi:hypothetical protein
VPQAGETRPGKEPGEAAKTARRPKKQPGEPPKTAGHPKRDPGDDAEAVLASDSGDQPGQPAEVVVLTAETAS